ncbi:glycerate kinase [Escherichia coli]|nr:hypothetical protein [Escherichia coli]EGJ3519052.1 hypothetical protein [Escherichia coli]EGK9747642.1 hypothetical protein [Escherichia coli]EHY7998502.1 glycerate kinase [Escherichia coli]EJQ3752341.1 glycerate kinase [Escherichia coli]
MKIVIAPDSFKESLSAEKCCQAIKAGFSTLFPDANYICLPIADGGEGTVDAMVAATGGNIVTLEVCGPMGEKVNAFYGITGDGKTAVIGIAGVLGDGVEVVHQYGIDAVFSILPRLAPLAEVLASGETNLFNSARNIACAIKIGQGIKN